MSDLVSETRAGGIATLTLNRPQALNALSSDMLAALAAALAGLAQAQDIRVIVLAAAGRAFCAGHDLREIQALRAAPDGGAAGFAALFAQCSALMAGLRRQPQPVIARVQGIATAAGCQLVASCDLAVAGTSARFGVNGVNIGLFCSTPMVALSRNIGLKAAFELLATGDMLEAEAAARLGLVNRVVPDADLDAATLALATRIAGKLGSTVRIGKRAFYEQAELGLDAAYAHTGAVIAANLMRADTAEGIQAFLDKRPAAWD